ncbi:MAG TPA: ABATE domain-containing protein [Gemmatimonadaceae bacterium]|nr:ABATE domain-containing protein [Gemmatimonadaceae bacterium]
MDDFHFVAGDLALDFVNTVADRLSHPRERLKTGTDVDRWARQAGLLGSQESLHMTPRQLGRLRAIREEVYAVVEPLAHGLMPPAPALNRLGRTRARAATTRRLVPCDDKLAWEWSDVDRLIGPVMEAAAELLVSVPSNRLRQCADVGCGWLFLDRSRAGRRRWCRMVDCGNRAKARRHYQRSRRS